MFELRLIYQNFKKEVMILEEFEYQNKKINNFFDQPYKYGFKTNIEKEDFPIGLNAEIIKNISVKKNEPKFLVNFRKNSFKIWNKLKFPNWGNFSEIEIDFNKIKYYSVPKKKKKLTSLEEVDPLILETFQKLGISLDEQKRISNVAIDAIFDSISIGTTFQNELAKHG
jgi:Fe-S cluster assembly protein SufB